MFETLLSPIELGHVRLKNRIIFAPTSMGLAEEEYFKRIEEPNVNTKTRISLKNFL